MNISWIFKNKFKQSKSKNEHLSCYKNDPNCTIEDVHNSDDLYLTSIQPSDSGLYECIASNMYHASISRAFYVTVQCTYKTLISHIYYSIKAKSNIALSIDV